MMILTARFAGAADAIDVQYRLSSYGHNLILNTTSWKNSDLTVSIQDEQDHVLLTKTYQSSKAFSACRFDLSALNRGQYKIFISDSEKNHTNKNSLF